MNEYMKKLMKAPSIEGNHCAFCGSPATNKHHVVLRSQGGSKGPTIPVCGMGNASGCHGLLHAHKLNVRYSEERGWEYIYTSELMKYEKALEIKDGWLPMKGEWSDD